MDYPQFAPHSCPTFSLARYLLVVSVYLTAESLFTRRTCMSSATSGVRSGSRSRDRGGESGTGGTVRVQISDRVRVRVSTGQQSTPESRVPPRTKLPVLGSTGKWHGSWCWHGCVVHEIEKPGNFFFSLPAREPMSTLAAIGRVWSRPPTGYEKRR
jgi:hypothetical protein